MGPGGRLNIDGLPRTVPAFVAFRHVDDSYFATMRMKVLRGRHFLHDDIAGAPLVGIVSESFARMIGSGGDVLGRQLQVPDLAVRRVRCRRATVVTVHVELLAEMAGGGGLSAISSRRTESANQR